MDFCGACNLLRKGAVFCEVCGGPLQPFSIRPPRLDSSISPPRRAPSPPSGTSSSSAPSLPTGPPPSLPPTSMSPPPITPARPPVPARSLSPSPARNPSPPTLPPKSKSSIRNLQRKGNRRAAMHQPGKFYSPGSKRYATRIKFTDLQSQTPPQGELSLSEEPAPPPPRPAFTHSKSLAGGPPLPPSRSPRSVAALIDKEGESQLVRSQGEARTKKRSTQSPFGSTQSPSEGPLGPQGLQGCPPPSIDGLFLRGLQTPPPSQGTTQNAQPPPQVPRRPPVGLPPTKEKKKVKDKEKEREKMEPLSSPREKGGGSFIKKIEALPATILTSSLVGKISDATKEEKQKDEKQKEVNKHRSSEHFLSSPLNSAFDTYEDDEGSSMVSFRDEVEEEKVRYRITRMAQILDSKDSHVANYLEMVYIARQQDFSDLDRLNFFYLSGRDTKNRSILILIANQIPKEKVDLAHIILYFIYKMDPLVEEPYVMVICESGFASDRRPNFSVLRTLHRLMAQKYKENVKGIFIIHPSVRTKILFRAFRPWIDSRFYHKLHYVDDPSSLYKNTVFSNHSLQLPENVLKFHRADGKVFGVPLDEVLMISREGWSLPTVLEDTIFYLCKKGLDAEGLFRISGRASDVEALRSAFDNGQEIDYSKYDVHAIASVLKLYLRKLPEPLLTFALYKNFLQAEEEYKTSKEKWREAIGLCISALPEPNVRALEILFLLLHKVASNHEKNRMTPENLSIVFGPVLLASATIDPMKAICHADVCNSCVCHLILNADEFFLRH